MIRDLVIELVSPLIIGGAGGGAAGKGGIDSPPTVRPPSLRGQLRFWSRALNPGGERGEENLATRLFGTTETGQRVRILGAQRLAEPGRAYLFPHKQGAARSDTSMVPPGDRVLVRFALPEHGLLEPLQAVVWTWLHLGSLGRRSRRGYGAFLWESHPGHLLDGFLPGGFDRGRDLAARDDLAAYLARGLDRVFAVLGITPEPRRSSRSSNDDFALRSLDQVFIGTSLTGAPSDHERRPGGSVGLVRAEDRDRDYGWHLEKGTGRAPGPTDATASLESLLHGLDPAARGGSPEREQLGLPKPRLPSPMLWRLYPSSAGGHLPVMVWSPVDYPPNDYPQLHADRAGPLCSYLSQDLGFAASLAGNSLTV